jgi:hypothetical protein
MSCVAVQRDTAPRGFLAIAFVLRDADARVTVAGR